SMLLLISEQGYGTCFMTQEVSVLSGGGKGVILQRIPEDDRLMVAVGVEKKSKILIDLKKGKPREIDVGSLTIGSRAKRGVKVVQRGAEVAGLNREVYDPQSPQNLSLF